MKKPMKFSLFGVIVMLLLISGCGIMGEATPTAEIPTVAVVSEPTVEPTPKPTFYLPPTYTPEASPTPYPTSTPMPGAPKKYTCNMDQTLKNLKSKVKYDQAVVLYNELMGKSYLVIWFVDPDLNPAAGENEIAANNELAMQHGLIVSQEMKAADPCVSQNIDYVNPVVVDKNYNGWYSAEIKPGDLPDTVLTDNENLYGMSLLAERGYSREQAPTKLKAAPAASCTWPEANEALHQHFSSARENVAFYYVTDEAATTLWAQWDSQPEMLQFDVMASLMNISEEMLCLHPQPTQLIFEVSDSRGVVLLVGMWEWAGIKAQDLNQVQVVYQK